MILIMKKWTREIEINAPIDQVWQLIDGSLTDMQKIMSNIITNEPVKKTKKVVGSVYKQRHRGEKGVQEYESEILEYENRPDYKLLKEEFNLGDLFVMTR